MVQAIWIALWRSISFGRSNRPPILFVCFPASPQRRLCEQAVRISKLMDEKQARAAASPAPSDTTATTTATTATSTATSTASSSGTVHSLDAMSLADFDDMPTDSDPIKRLKSQCRQCLQYVKRVEAEERAAGIHLVTASKRALTDSIAEGSKPASEPANPKQQ
jgi:hypothetical protein